MSKKMTDAEKLAIVRREALYTGLALAVLIVFWLVAGFGLAGVDVKIFHIPLWAIAGTIGVWLFAICVSWVLSRKLFRDMDLGGDGNE